MSSLSIRNILSVMFFLIAMTPIFSMIEFRDTTQLPQCDTIIDKKGVVSVVKISTLTRFAVTYTLCNDTSERIHTRNLEYIQDIKSKTFATNINKIQKKRERKPLLTRANAALQFVFFGALAFIISFWGFALNIEGDNTSDFLLTLFLITGIISSIMTFGGFIWCINLLSKAKKEGNKQAANLARWGIFIMSLFSLVVFLLIRALFV
jgi:ribonucleotide reductase beta subunit family protein with ferritin-like domain